jgi:hypothetical protein
MTDLEALNLLIATGDKVTSARLDYLQQTLGVNKLFLSEEFNQLKKGLRYLRDSGFDPSTADLADFLNESADPFVRESELPADVPDATPNIKGIDFRKIFSFTNEISHTGTTLYTRLGSITIPANTIQVGDVWEIEILVKRTSTNAVSSGLIFAGFESIGHEAFSGAGIIGGRGINPGNRNQVKITQSIKINTNEAIYFRNSGGFYYENQNMQSRQNHVFNPTIQQTINFGLQLNNATDIAIVEYLIFKKIN